MDNYKQYNTQSVGELLYTHGIKLSKSMGQNFLVDPNIPKKIAKQTGIDSSCGVLEIGPGLGALTAQLAETAGHVTALELDKRLIPILQEQFKNQENISILQGDILKVNINEILENTMPGLNYQVCANLPYNITTPAITAFIESNAFSSITIMIQKEVAKRICANPGTPEYGAFTVFVNYHSSPKKLFDVSPECFIPRPKVTSSVIKMEIKNKKLLNNEQEKQFFKVVRAAFGQRRKTLVNSLYTCFTNTQSKESIIDIVENCGFDVRIRGEALSVDDFMKLSLKL